MRRSMPDDYVRIPKQWLALGKALCADLFVHFPQNASIVRLRSKGDVISADDMETMKKIPPENLFISRRDAILLFGTATREIGNQLKEPGSSNSPEVQAAAQTILSGLAIEPTSADVDPAVLARDLLSEVATLMEETLSAFTKNRGVPTYERALARWKSQKGELVSHHRQVSALAALIQLAVGSTSDQEFIDIAMAGLVHDLGLTGLPTALRERHCRGEGNFNPSEKIIYLRHIDETIQLLKRHEIELTDGARRIVAHHHENWDGSGFRGLKMGQIYRPGRILRIADAMVPLLNVSPSRGFVNLLEEIAKENGTSGIPLFDPGVVARLLVDMGRS